MKIILYQEKQLIKYKKLIIKLKIKKLMAIVKKQNYNHMEIIEE